MSLQNPILIACSNDTDDILSFLISTCCIQILNKHTAPISDATFRNAIETPMFYANLDINNDSYIIIYNIEIIERVLGICILCTYISICK